MNHEENVNFQEFLNSRLRERGFSLEKLSKISGIALKHLENLARGDLEHLPAAPYLHGYIIRLGQILDFDGEAWWEKIKKEEGVKRSGARDELPKNRFARSSIKPSTWLALAAILFLIFYFGFRFAQIFGEPTIIVNEPAADPTTVTVDTLVVSGKLENGDSLTVNSSTALLHADGSWEETILLQPGLNTITITAKKTLGREKTVVRHVNYELPPQIATSTPAF